jgi:hypothetical protein
MGSGGGAGTRGLDRMRNRFGSSLDLHPPLHPADDAAAFGLPLQRAWFSETTRPDAKITKERLDNEEIPEAAAGHRLSHPPPLSSVGRRKKGVRPRPIT